MNDGNKSTAEYKEALRKLNFDVELVDKLDREIEDAWKEFQEAQERRYEKMYDLRRIAMASRQKVRQLEGG
jgi:uncharacterized membrane protein (DUF106 family)